MKILENMSILFREAILDKQIMLEAGSKQEKDKNSSFKHEDVLNNM